MDGPLFSVIVPTYGREQLLGEAVRSVLAQTIQDLECLVVDDASPSPTTVPDDPRVRLLQRETNGGPAAARNTGLDAARGRVVTFLDDDDVYLPRRLELALPALKRADIAVCHRADLSGASSTAEVLEGEVHGLIGESINPHLGQTALPRDVCPRFDERFFGCEDIDWWIRATRRLRVTTEPDVGYLVRAHGGPRYLNGVPARIAGSRLLLQVHRDYFAAYPRARAFRELRIGLLALAIHDRSQARRALIRSLRAHPEARTAWHLARALVPNGTRSGVDVAVQSEESCGGSPEASRYPIG